MENLNAGIAPDFLEKDYPTIKLASVSLGQDNWVHSAMNSSALKSADRWQEARVQVHRNRPAAVGNFDTHPVWTLMLIVSVTTAQPTALQHTDRPPRNLGHGWVGGEGGIALFNTFTAKEEGEEEATQNPNFTNVSVNQITFFLVVRMQMSRAWRLLSIYPLHYPC